MRVATAVAFVAGAAAALGGAYGVHQITSTEPQPGLTEADVQGVVKNWLAENPEAVVDAIRTYQAQQEERQAADREQAIADRWDELAHAEGDPILGNADGDVTIVEFFDYRCGFCKKMLPAMTALQADDPKVRIVMKEFPILGPESVLASRVALAADRQGRYAEMHEALMASAGQLDSEQIFTLAEQTGLDMERLRQDMQDPAVDAILRRNLELADELGIRGTPAFVTRSEAQPGAISGDTLRRMIEKARKQTS